MRQAGGTKHQRHTERQRINRVFHHRAGAHNRLAFFMDGSGLLEHIFQAEIGMFQHQKGNQRGAAQQQYRFNHLHPSGGQHTTEQYIHHHQHAHQNHGGKIVQTKQQLNQLACAYYLGDQIQNHNQKRTGRRKRAHRLLLEAVSRHIREGKLTQIAQAIGNQEQHNRPTHQKAHRINQAVVTASKHNRRYTQESGSRHIIAGNRQTVARTGNPAAAGIKIFGGFVLFGRPFSNKQSGANKQQEHHNRRPVGGLFLYFTGDGVRRPNLRRQ